MFGMGTGGSLRLLSPETFSGLDFLRTLKTAQVGFPSAVRPRQLPFSLSFSHKLSRMIPRLSYVSLVRSRFPIPHSSSLIPHSSADQALDRLVSSSSIRCRTSTDDLSTLSSSRGLTCSRSGNSLLWGGFTLRCLQRLSRPHFASQLCPWQNNCFTRGASIPVLSY